MTRRGGRLLGPLGWRLFTAIPAAATATTGMPSTRGGWISLLTASAVTIPETTSNAMPLAAADRISARFQPKVQAPAAGRAAGRIAHCAAAIAPTFAEAAVAVTLDARPDPLTRPPHWRRG